MWFLNMINLIHIEIDLYGIIPHEIYRVCSIMLIIIDYYYIFKNTYRAIIL